MTRSIYRVAAGVLTASAVGIQYVLTVGDASGAELARLSLRFFSFFTILTTLIAAAALLAPVLVPRSTLGSFFARPTVRTAIAGYMIMVGVVYYVLLAGLSHRVGWSLFFEHVLHAVTPPLFVIDWLAFVDKRSVDWRVGLRSLGYPLVYVAWTLAHGAATGWYPYPFLDVPQHGYARVLVNIVGLVASYIVLELALVAIGRCTAARERLSEERR